MVVWKKWDDAKLAGAPREVILAVLLSNDASEATKKWAVTNMDWSLKPMALDGGISDPWERSLRHVPARVALAAIGPSSLSGLSEAVTGALSDPANDVLRHLTTALVYRPTAGTCDRIVAAMASRCETAALCDFLGDCLSFLPAGCASQLAYRGHFEKAGDTFWASEPAPRVSLVHVLGHRFWAAVDTFTAGAQTQRAVDAIRTVTDSAESPTDAAVARACAAVAILGSLTDSLASGLRVEARVALDLAAASPLEALAAEATFASAVLGPPPGSDADAAGLRDRLLKLARPSSRTPAIATVHRAAQELAYRFAGDSVVHAALKADAERGTPTAFVDACTKGPGLPLISSEIACVLFQWLEPADCTRLATRLWDPLADAEKAVVAGYSPLHVAAARSRSDFIAVYAGQPDVDVDAVVNAESKNGDTPLSLAGSRTVGDDAAIVECALLLVALRAQWGHPKKGSANALHAAQRLVAVHNGPGGSANALAVAERLCREARQGDDITYVVVVVACYR